MTKKLNRAKCAKCGDIIVSRHRHDFKSCSCEEIHIDGGNDYCRGGAKNMSNFLVYRNRKWVSINAHKENIITRIYNRVVEILRNKGIKI
jgi:hypothetical protein